MPVVSECNTIPFTTCYIVTFRYKAFTTVSETTQGYLEDVKLEGKTLVNLCPNETFSTPTYNDKKWKYKYFTLKQPIKPNTIYTVIFNVVTNSANVLDIYLGGKGNTFNLTNVEISSLGTYIVKVTSIANGLDYSKLFVQFSDMYDIGEFSCQITILEGDHTDKDISFFEGLKSVGQGSNEISVESVNENLISEKMILTNKAIRNSDGVLIDDIGSTIIENFKVNSNITYYFTGENVNRRTLFKYDYNNKYLGFEDLTNNSFSVDNNVRFVTIKVGYYSNNSSVVSGLMVSTKETLRNTPHKQDKKEILYHNPNTETWEKPVLREWDSIEKHSDGKYY